MKFRLLQFALAALLLSIACNPSPARAGASNAQDAGASQVAQEAPKAARAHAAITTRAEEAAEVPSRLRYLASRAQTRRGWADLRRYARSVANREWRGLAYFALGYREYMAREDGLAAEDLKAAANGPLADVAAYYEALAGRQINRSDDAIAALTDFRDRYPQSVYRLRAADLLAGLLIQAGRPAQALAELQAEPLTKRRPSSLLLAAQAKEALHDDIAAAQAYQLLYAAFPAVDEARRAQTALNRLRQRLGPRYPEMNDEAQTARAQNLFQLGRFRQALAAYDNALLTSPKSALAGEWRVGRARCFIALREYALALTALSPKEKDRDLDAERLSLRVRIAELSGSTADVTGALDALYRKYPTSSYYGDALVYAGGYFARQGFWQTAAGYYKQLSTNFPDSLYAGEATWRVAWYSVLAGNLDAAQGQLAGFLKLFPGSPLTPAALYWLAQVERKQSQVENATQIERLLAARYANTYYGLRARQELIHLPRVEPPGEGEDETGNSALAALGIVIPARPAPRIPPCGASALDSAQDKQLATYRAMAALDLTELGEQYLEEAMSLHMGGPEMALALARSRAARKDVAGALFAAKQSDPNYEAYPFSALPEEAWKLLYPRSDWSVVRRYARLDGLDPYLVMGLIRQESAFDPRATSYTGARGLMQMEPYTAVDRVRGRWRRLRVVRSLYSPAYNIRAGCLYLRGLLRSFNNGLPETLAAYNAGDIRVRQWIANSKINDPDEFLETIPFTDTRAYVEMVLRDRMIYHELLSGRVRFKSCPAGSEPLAR